MSTMPDMAMRPPEPGGGDPQTVIALVRRWLARTAPAEAMEWLDREIEHQATGTDERRLGIALGLSARKLGRQELALPAEEMAAAQAVRPGWQPQFWSAGEAARVALLIATHRGDDAAFAARLDRLCVTAEVSEHMACMKGLAVFPAGRALLGRARDGMRSSIATVFEAVACRNPYPFDYFEADAWNQMVVKCVFGGTPISTIVGLYQRCNSELIAMLRDLVAERNAAGRTLPKAVHDLISDWR
jgi:hypothetical protein